MELLKRNIHMNKSKGKVISQITLDEDFNLPENKLDMNSIILKQADIVLESVKPSDEKVGLKGKLQFEVLYGTEGSVNSGENYTGFLPFDETINVPELGIKDHIQTKWEIEDMTATIINSRKLRISAIITFEVRGETLYEESAAYGVEGNDDIQTKSKLLDVVQIKLQKKDTYRIKEEMEIPSNKPNIDRLLWRGLDLRSVECKPSTDKLVISGEVVLFVIYKGEEDHIPIQWMEKNVSFHGEVDAPNCNISMISATKVSLIHKEIEAKPDYDGENRVVSLDAVLELDIKLYEEESVEILSDMYATTKEVVPKYGEACFESLLVKNVAKCKVSDKIKIAEDSKILQICHSNGCVKIDRVSVEEDGLKVEGAISVSCLYMSADDKSPMGTFQGAIPFSHLIEAGNVTKDCVYELMPYVDQLTTVMLGTDEVEVRGVITIDAFVLNKVIEPILTNVAVQPFDEKKREAMPGIVGYIVKSNDTLWDVAKRFSTTPEVIIETNGLPGDQLKSGERILVVKKGENL